VVPSPNGRDNLVRPSGGRPLDGVDEMRRRRNSDSPGKQGEPSLSPSGSIAWAISVLKDQGMPSEEIVAILGADDPVLVSRYLELHRERFEEHLAAQRRTLARIEGLFAARSLATAASGGTRRTDNRRSSTEKEAPTNWGSAFRCRAKRRE